MSMKTMMEEIKENLQAINSRANEQRTSEQGATAAELDDLISDMMNDIDDLCVAIDLKYPNI